MSTVIYQVDAFAEAPFTGNPAAVCVMGQPASEKWMQQVAQEMNLSETAFLYPIDEGYSLRWFTPEAEVDLCGHATLASAHILWETGMLNESVAARFFTRSGWLTAERNGEWIRMDFPADVPKTTASPVDLESALDVSAVQVSKGMDWLIELEDEQVLCELNPDLHRLAPLFDTARGLVVTCRSNHPNRDIVSRAFYSDLGVLEDPVTGSAHCMLAPYWQNKLGKSELTGYQASKRGGVVRMEVQGERVLLYGKAVTVMKGSF
ncbi:isomerase [Marinithermofilum abyssi]|uniref:Isomerase n=1 Tax=Marinithermofilum abyssi TaxID=1571185 RepID=A0A8J2YCA4_9BACL|nr:isomerase [Marinithermofilum abyssi]